MATIPDINFSILTKFTFNSILLRDIVNADHGCVSNYIGDVVGDGFAHADLVPVTIVGIIFLHPQMILADLVEARELHHLIDFGIALLACSNLLSCSSAIFKSLLSKASKARVSSELKLAD